jgi:3-phenylpropionate/trans-cinnamate dioxygenase ferredoxin subunit
MPDVQLCKVGDVADGAARRFDVDGRRLCAVNIGGRFFVVDDECSHEDYSLSEGDVWPDECEIECPKHGSTFLLTSGEPQTLPATKPVAVYDVRVEGDDVIVGLP